MTERHVVTIVGARPQFVKAAVVSRALQVANVRETLIHSGQHYDTNVSQVFFDELGIPMPALNLGVGSGSHAAQTGAVMEQLETALVEMPAVDWLIVYGDTNTTLAAAMVAAKLGIPLAHIEAGLRSFNRKMPEEINRIVTDRLSDALLCPTQTAVDHLANEGMTQGVYLSGDVMLDATRYFAALAAGRLTLDSLVPFSTEGYALATLHRPSNVDTPARLQAIFDGLGALDQPVVMPVHPRTRSRLDEITVPGSILLLAPVGYLAMLTLLRNANVVVTDSGGLQKEAYWLERPCVTVRNETEWVETLENDWNQLVQPTTDALVRAIRQGPKTKAPAGVFGKPAGGEGEASTRIVEILTA